MGWFAVDDGFDNHPKIRKAGNAAAGLFCRLGAYSSRSATEGTIPGPVARDYGTAAQLRKLADLGMLHPHGHACKDCVQPEPGGFVMHDYLQYNRSRKEIEDARKAGVERQRRRRERLAAEARATETAAPTGVSGGVAPGVAGEPSGGVAGEPPVSDKNRRSAKPVTPDGAEERARTIPSPPHVVPPTEVLPTDCETGPTPVAFIGDRPRIPVNCRPLVDAITAAGMVVGWDLKPSEWFLIEALIKRCTIPILVDDATKSWHGSREPVRSGKYFIPAWRKLPDIPDEIRHLPAITSGPEPSRHTSRQQQETDAWFDRAMTRALTKEQQERDAS